MAAAPGASGMTLVYRPTPFVRFMQHARGKLKNNSAIAQGYLIEAWS
jgi:hypothetical protein